MHLCTYNTLPFLNDRSPDDAKIKQKMLFASSRDALRRSLVGIATEIQGTDYSEIDHDVGMHHLLLCCHQDMSFTDIMKPIVVDKVKRTGH